MVTLGSVPQYTSSYALVRPSPSHSAASSTRKSPRFGPDVASRRGGRRPWATTCSGRLERVVLVDDVVMRDPFEWCGISRSGRGNDGVPIQAWLLHFNGAELRGVRHELTLIKAAGAERARPPSETLTVESAVALSIAESPYRSPGDPSLPLSAARGEGLREARTRAPVRVSSSCRRFARSDRGCRAGFDG
jgi:hypothetical protein